MVVGAANKTPPLKNNEAPLKKRTVGIVEPRVVVRIPRSCCELASEQEQQPKARMLDPAAAATTIRTHLINPAAATIPEQPQNSIGPLLTEVKVGLDIFSHTILNKLGHAQTRVCNVSTR